MTTTKEIDAERRRTQIIKMKTADPDMTLESIGREVGVSRERVRQVLSKEGIKTSKDDPTCADCGVILRPSVIKPYTDPKTNKRYCKSCRNTMVFGIYQCHTCGKEVKRRKKQIRNRQQKHVFCNKTCLGKYIGTHYARGRSVKA